MKKSILLAFSVGLSLASYAAALDKPDKAKAVKNSINKLVLQMKGVNGIGITGCDPQTGEKYLDGDFVHCISIMTETRDAERALKELLPLGTKVEGVYVTVEYVGPIGPQPRMSTGN